MKRIQFGDKVTVKQISVIDTRYNGAHGVVVGTNAREGSARVSFKWPTMKSKWISKEKLIKGWK